MTFWRTFHLINEDVAFVLGFTSNLLILIIIKATKVKAMQKYNILLLQCCCIDMFQVMVSFIVKPILVFHKGNMYYLSNGFLRSIGGWIEMSGIILWATSACFCVSSMPISYIFRYRTICLNAEISKTFYVTTLIIAFLSAFSYGINVLKFHYLDNRHLAYLAEDSLSWLIDDSDGRVKAASFCPAVSSVKF